MSSDEESARSLKVLPNRQHAKKFLSLLANLLAISATLLFFNRIANAQDQDDPRDLLLHVRENVLDTIGRLPRYLCTQTVDRSRYEPPNNGEATDSRHNRSCDDTIAQARRTNRERRLSSSDRLRFDVAVNGSVPGEVNEMYSWAGEDRFGDRDLFEFVRDGSISTGSFSSMLTTIFGSNVASFSYSGDNVVNGRLLSEFGFRIAQEKSSYMYVFGNGPRQQTMMAYDGTILVDPEHSDLVRLVIRSGQLPSETGACELTQTLDYRRVRLHNADFLLPSEVRVSVIHTDGTEAENRIQYSECREFRGRSVIRFPASEEAGLKQSETTTPVPPLSLPPGTPLKVVFTDAINTATAAAGDPIRGRLTSAIRDRSSNVLVPEGASVTGRITSIRRYYEANTAASESRNANADPGWVTILTGPQGQISESQNTRPSQPPLVLKIKLEKLDFAGASHLLDVAFDSGLRRFVKPKGKLSKRVQVGSLDASPDSNTGSFEFWETSPNYVVKSGLESNWVTLAP